MEIKNGTDELGESLGSGSHVKQFCCDSWTKGYA